MLKNLEEFWETYVMGAGYEIHVPDLDDTVVWPFNQSYGDQCFGCYKAAIQAGLRFPLDKDVEKILDGYCLGVWQLTPNSWVNVLGYVAACNMQGVKPGFEAFASMHYLSKAPKVVDPRFMMTRGEESKWKDWRNRFYIISLLNTRWNQKYNSWNRNPFLLGQKAILPPVLDEGCDQILTHGLFKVSTKTLEGGNEREIIPHSYIPRFEWLRDPFYLAACGLSIRKTKGSWSDETI